MKIIKASQGTSTDMLNAFRNKLDDMEVDTSTKVTAALDSYNAEYLAKLEDELYVELLSDIEDEDFFNIEHTEDSVYITISDVDPEEDILEYRVPFSDLSFNLDKLKEDVQYILDAIDY